MMIYLVTYIFGVPIILGITMAIDSLRHSENDQYDLNKAAIKSLAIALFWPFTALYAVCHLLICVLIFAVNRLIP